MLDMNERGDDDDAGGAIPPGFLAELMRLLQSATGGPQSGLSWDTAKQIAISVATGGQSEHNADPGDRLAIQELARVADLHVQNRTGLSTLYEGRAPEVVAVNRTTWTMRTLDSYRPLLSTLGESMGRISLATLEEDTDAASDPMLAMLGPMLKALNPTLLGMTAGSMVGHLGTRALGSYDLPIPRHTNDVMVIGNNLAQFGQDWSLPHDDLRLWVCLHELTHHTVLSLPHVDQRITSLLQQHAGKFSANHAELNERFANFDPMALLQAGSNPDAAASLQQLFGDPSSMLGMVQSPQQRTLLPFIEAVICRGRRLCRSHHGQHRYRPDCLVFNAYRSTAAPPRRI